MKVVYLFFLIAFTMAISGCQHNSQKAASSEIECVKPKLGYPFGTILQLEVELTDGDSFQLKELANSYVIRVKRVNGKSLEKSTAFTYRDESLSKVFDERNNISGKEFNVVAYESGAFGGIPEGFEKYRELQAGKLFGFQHQLIIIQGTPRDN